MKIVKHLLLIFIVVLPFTGVFAQAPKFGHIDVNAVFMAMPEFSAIQKTLDDETARLESQFTVMKEDLTKMELEFEQTAANLTPEQQEQKRTEYFEMVEKVQAFVENSQQTLEQRYAELQQPVLNKLLKAVEDVGIEENMLYIFQVNIQQVSFALYYSSQSIDVAPFVKKKLGIQ